MEGKENNESLEKSQALFNKLRRPIHYTYVAKYILMETEEETLATLNKLKDAGLLEESKYAKGYFVNSTGPSGPSSI